MSIRRIRYRNQLMMAIKKAKRKLRVFNIMKYSCNIIFPMESPNFLTSFCEENTQPATKHLVSILILKKKKISSTSRFLLVTSNE